METSEVRKRVRGVLDRAKRAAADRRVKVDEAARQYDEWLMRVAVPLFRQVAGILKAEGLTFQLFTPQGSVRLVSDRRTEDSIELTLDTTGERPLVLGRTSRLRGRRVTETELLVGTGE